MKKLMTAVLAVCPRSLRVEGWLVLRACGSVSFRPPTGGHKRMLLPPKGERLAQYARKSVLGLMAHEWAHESRAAR
jgi:hypothetical protein